MAIKITLNSNGIEAVLKSEAMKDALGKKAAAIAAAAGDGYVSEATIGRTRALAMAWADTDAANVAERDDLTLTRSIDAGRA